ncbi:Oidioi.mRNA.OKI2018_I69.XSR.g14985.t1.cds [Oikopleura dioica]|uniref:Oidioi.mRNA.OKI2018_I69.XSR.g14985.t1.cds n=1 Tax=Oikopleura dioica TaxID=34765 RepID=A0ABN7SGF5_OIKDI|nr:Oidioi.mRNA.OKI2018_I69.XSR.g14985.t1.cds [Oikopleura dioica]
MPLEKTGSAKTVTGNVRTVRLNTYRERKFECQELEKENNQLSNTIVQLQDIICAKDEEMKILRMQVADQEIIKDKFDQLKGEVVKVGSKLETSFTEEIEQSETIEVVTERIVQAAPSTPPPPPSPEIFIDYDPRPDVAFEAAKMDRLKKENALIFQNEMLQTSLDQEILKNAALEEHLVTVKQQLAHELKEKEGTVRELRQLKHELASLNVKLSAVELKNSGAFGKCVYLIKLLSMFTATFASQLVSL